MTIEEQIKDILKRLSALEKPPGKPGTGVCICQQSPDMLRRMAANWNEPIEKVNANMLLDHRCAKHGEKAQPTLWGRHKELQLSVTWAQWESLGVTYDEPSG